MTETAALHPRPGDCIAGKYRVERVLGSGGMGVVVSALHVQLQERVALKFLLSGVPHEGEAGTRFLREARAAVRIRNDHVVRVMDVGTLDDGAPYLVMEYLDGRDLAAELEERGRFAVREAVDLVLQACEALAEAHALGIVHRDLKPANLFLTRRANGALWVKVMDFGISKVPAGAHEAVMTRTQAVLGSPAYMSPEQLRAARDVDARTDIWALGVVLFQLVSGEIPFKGETLSDLCIRIATESSLRLTELCPDAPRAFEAVIERCLEKDRERRYANVTELARALAPFGTKQWAAETLAPWGRSSGTSRRGRRRWLTAAALAAALMAGLAAAYSFTMSSGHHAESSHPSAEVQPPKSAPVVEPSSFDASLPASDGPVAVASARPTPSGAAPPGSALRRVNASIGPSPAARPVKPRSKIPPSNASEKRSPVSPSATASVFDSRKL